MSTRTLIGVAAPRGVFTARYLHHGAEPAYLVPVLRSIWWRTFDRDSAAMADALLAVDWSELTADPEPPRLPGPAPVAGTGYPIANSADAPSRATLGERVDGWLEWLYLLHTDRDLVVVYEATCHGRWLRHSVHHLDPVDELFITEPHPDGDHQPALTVCTVCGAVDDIAHHELPSMLGYGTDTGTACLRCGSCVTTDPAFGAHVTRNPWPPHPDTPSAPIATATAEPAWVDAAVALDGRGPYPAQIRPEQRCNDVRVTPRLTRAVAERLAADLATHTDPNDTKAIRFDGDSLVLVGAPGTDTEHVADCVDPDTDGHYVLDGQHWQWSTVDLPEGARLLSTDDAVDRILTGEHPDASAGGPALARVLVEGLRAGLICACQRTDGRLAFYRTDGPPA